MMKRPRRRLIPEQCLKQCLIPRSPCWRLAVEGIAVPIYEYRCRACGAVFSRLFRRYADATPHELCPECGADQTQRLMSSFAVSGHVDPGPGRAAWPTSWEDTRGGDPETLRYWRRRIERESRLEEKYPELSDPALRNGSGTSADTSQPGAQQHAGHHHHHEHAHPHSHEHGSGAGTPGEAPHTHGDGGAHTAHTERGDGSAHAP
jgi:putative FmdB family regulatory protein